MKRLRHHLKVWTCQSLLSLACSVMGLGAAPSQATSIQTAPSRATPSGPALDLRGYTDASGAITVQHRGDTVDPYFALQALGIAQVHGLDISAYALPWARWLAQRYQEAGHLGRYCQSAQPLGSGTGTTWYWCKPPDADDSSLALWLQFLHRLAPHQRAQLPIDALQARAAQDLRALLEPITGLYLVSPHIRYSLFMDNLEVWSAWPSPSLARAIHATYWDPAHRLFRVSTQKAHPHPGHHFYPDATAQIYPLVVNFAGLPGGAGAHYAQWMREHRAAWLAQSGHEFPWGLIALVAWRQGDLVSVRCWQQRAMPHRHTALWTITDEVIAQILPPWPTPPYTPPQENCT